MKVFLSLLVLILNIYFGSTSGIYPEERYFEEDYSTMDKKWPEQTFLSGTEDRENNEEVVTDERIQSKQEVADNVRNKLFSKDYFRLNDEESTEKLSGPVQANIANEPDSHELKLYEAEIAAGNVNELFGTNPHYYQPEEYKDLGRRFVLQYPYKEDNDNSLFEDAEDNRLTPKLAAPELVLAVAKESAILDAAKPINPTEKLIQQNMLRTGEYWNTFWKEDVDPDKIILRSSKGNKMESVKAKLSPGTKLYDYVSKLRQLSPKLLYVINKKNV